LRLSRRLSHSCTRIHQLLLEPRGVVGKAERGEHHLDAGRRAPFLGLLADEHAVRLLDDPHRDRLALRRCVGVGVGVGGVGVALGPSAGPRSGGTGEGSALAVARAIGRGVASMVGAVGRSGGGSMIRSIRWSRLRELSPAPNAFV
jgi:hypothetical protein